MAGFALGIAGLATSAGLGFAQLQSQEKSQKKALKLQEAQQKMYYKLAVGGVVVVGVVLVIWVFKR